MLYKFYYLLNQQPFITHYIVCLRPCISLLSKHIERVNPRLVINSFYFRLNFACTTIWIYFYSISPKELQPRPLWSLCEVYCFSSSQTKIGNLLQSRESFHILFLLFLIFLLFQASNLSFWCLLDFFLTLNRINLLIFLYYREVLDT